MTNKSMFLSSCHSRNIAIKELAAIVDMKYQTLIYKINGRYEFNSSEIAKIKRALNLSNDDVCSIFFA